MFSHNFWLFSLQKNYLFTICALQNWIGAPNVEGFRVFSYKELKTATSDFKSSNKIGEGSFGSVYKVLYFNKASAFLSSIDESF